MYHKNGQTDFEELIFSIISSIELFFGKGFLKLFFHQDAQKINIQYCWTISVTKNL